MMDHCANDRNTDALEPHFFDILSPRRVEKKSIESRESVVNELWSVPCRAAISH